MLSETEDIFDFHPSFVCKASFWLTYSALGQRRRSTHGLVGLPVGQLLTWWDAGYVLTRGFYSVCVSIMPQEAALIAW